MKQGGSNMFLATLTLLVAGVTVSKCITCDAPGVVPAAYPNQFAFCTYNEDGDLVARLLPCADGTTLVGNDRWEMVSEQECLVRRRREVVYESAATGSENRTETVLNEQSTETGLQSEASSTSVPEKVEDTTETVVQSEKSSTEAPNNSTDEEAATTDETEEASGSPAPESTSTEPEDPITMASNTNDTKLVECWYPGVMCTSCSEAAFCVGTGTFKNGQPHITPVTTITCASNEVCVDLVGCVSDEGRLCTKGEFSCTDQGLFPDPYDCRMFHSCVFLNGAFRQDDVQCLAGAYNSKTGTCGYPLNSATCLNKPVPHCKQEFEVGAVPSNPNLYYVCVKKGKVLSPSLFRCPGGRKFTTALFKCMP